MSQIYGIGCDVVELERVAQMMERRERFLEKLFTENERQYFSKYQEPLPSISGHLAAKEALAKALGTGFRKDINWKSIEISHNELGKPLVQIHSDAHPDLQFELSISHSKTVAMAMVVAFSN